MTQLESHKVMLLQKSSGDSSERNSHSEVSSESQNVGYDILIMKLKKLLN